MQSTSISMILFTLLAATSFVHAHSWVEQLTVIAPNGTFVGEPGYPRGNVKRSEPGFGDPKMVHLITGTPSDPMCKNTQKTPASQSASSPPLKAAPGANVALRFQENGHVTLPQNQLGKPENRGDIFVYGTTQPKDNELFNDVHGVWTADGKGGDGRGVLLAKASYDDGQCYQINGGAISTQRQKQFAHAGSQLMGADLWCQTDIKIPSDLSTGKLYTLYWVWTWPTAPSVDPGLPAGKNETYTTCMDVSPDSAAPNFSQKMADQGFVQGQPIENAAVPAQFAKLGDAPAVAGSSASAPAPALSAQAPSAPAPSASASSASAPAPPASTSFGPIPPASGPSGAPSQGSPTTLVTVTVTANSTSHTQYPNPSGTSNGDRHPDRYLHVDRNRLRDRLTDLLCTLFDCSAEDKRS
jgi:hypothetical protein